jgi:predicted dehydrogenase
MNRGNLSRRGFLQRSLAGLTAAGLPAWAAREAVAAADEAKAAAAKASNDVIIMGAIGIGGPPRRGRDIYNEAKTAGKAGAHYVAACDVDSDHLQFAIEKVMAPRGDTGVKGYKDFRELLDRKDIQAVTIAVPDHWHALVAIEALKRGKDVYCEKPLTLTIAEALAVAQVANQTGRVFQTGNQQRSEFGGMFRTAAELARNGRIGKIKRIECCIGDNPTSGELPKAPPPKGLDYEFWLGPAPQADYVDNGKDKRRCHYEFRWWYEYSGGKMTDWGAHHLDIAQWALGKDGSGPVAVEVVRAVQPEPGPNRYNTHPSFDVKFTYDTGTEVHAVNRGQELNLVNAKGEKVRMPGGREGVLMEGEGGQIFVNRSRLLASDAKLLTEPLSSGDVRLERHGLSHMGNFLQCVRTRQKPICHADIGASSVIVCHLGTICLRLNKPLKWDPSAHRFDNEEANAMLSRPYRAPWKLEV